jgi:hypothetical protein
MVALRMILGIFEAGFFPGSVYLLRYVIWRQVVDINRGL